MTTALKRIPALVAIVAIALQVLFAGLTCPQIARAGFDPTSFICHSGGGPADQQAPQPGTTDDCCSHCILCFAPALAAAPDLTAMLVEAPQTAADAMAPLSGDAVPVHNLNASQYARGPPLQV